MHLACWQPTLGQDETNQPCDLQWQQCGDCGREQTLGDCCNLTRPVHVSSDSGRDCLEITVVRCRCTDDSRSRLRVALLQALAWYRTPHSQGEPVPQCSNAVRRCMGLRRGPLAADIVGQSAARTTESAQPCGMGSSGQARVKWQPAPGRGRWMYLAGMLCYAMLCYMQC